MSNIRVRFAPSPTGMMHLGNIRTAILNYLFACQKNGTFILRIEDTDPERNFDPNGIQIINDLAWLGLQYQEGPDKDGSYGPYQQSQRLDIYQETLEQLIRQQKVYRCFCTETELNRKRERQIALKQPPRYDRTCANLSAIEIEQKLKASVPYIWRFKIDPAHTVTISDLARGTVNFDMAHFSDFPITRSNGSFTFIFANTVDDILMDITHVFRGDDHLSNTANQAVIYAALDKATPIFWHMPILCNVNGKKLSKRDFGFALIDLKNEGYLPEAINNYLTIIGHSFEHEIMNLDRLSTAYPFDNVGTSSNIKYDIEKLTWVNHKWIERYSDEHLTEKALPFLHKIYPASLTLDPAIQKKLIVTIRSELKTLNDITHAAQFYFQDPILNSALFDTHLDQRQRGSIKALTELILPQYTEFSSFIQQLKTEAKAYQLSTKAVFTFVRLALTGSAHGPQLHDIVPLIGQQKAQDRIKNGIQYI